jgi:UDP-N-acetylglucosamine--N-acetylmuramyl-(pentapeptide) pyrophosphoryl-undecaprenol N-acetylglucosamine transferase
MSDITFFSSPIGLGHVTRDSAIVKHFENISTKFVTGSSAVKFLNDSGFDVVDVYNPPNFMVQDGSLKNPLRWLWRYYKYYKDCKEISLKIIEKEKPKLVVTDEDFASATISQEKKISTVLITDVLETRFAKGIGSLIEKKMNRSMRDILNKCEAVILPESGSDEDNIRRVGPIVRCTKHTREELRKKLSFDKKTIVVSIGGTDAGKFLIEKVVSTFSKIKDAELVIVSGPSFQKNYGKNIRSLGYVNNLHEVIYASDVLISLAGKSTIDEAKAYGTPGIFIPIKDHFEQEDNANEEGYSFDDINRLESLILEKLEEKRNPVQTNGSKKAYEIIKKFLY